MVPLNIVYTRSLHYLAILYVPALTRLLKGVYMRCTTQQLSVIEQLGLEDTPFLIERNLTLLLGGQRLCGANVSSRYCG